jgi:hypothetical protein
MALSAEIVAQAKSEAGDFLEYSIYVLCTVLSVDVETASSAMDIPVEESDPSYFNYLSLKRQLAALEAIDS